MTINTIFTIRTISSIFAITTYSLHFITISICQPFSVQSPIVNTVYIFGYTDNTGSYAANERVSNSRADAVRTFLVNKGVTATRITALGVPMAEYVATNETAEGRAQNRRVEVYISANEEMIKKAEAGTLQ